MFTDVSLSSFLGVEGILVDDFGIIEESGDLWDSIYCVHLQRQYSAARELNAFLEKYKMDVSRIVDESEITYLRALEVCTYMWTIVVLIILKYRIRVLQN